jgi:hypothetical protein
MTLEDSMRRFALLLVALFAAFPFLATACGDDSGVPDGSNGDATFPDGPGADVLPTTDGGGGGDGTLFGDGNPNCTPLGNQCLNNADCCSGNCANGSCQPPPCTSDNQACTTNADCCSGTCGTGGTCTPLNGTCKTLGNQCTNGSECCSLFCENGICAQPSYCGQNGDICAQDTDCCGGICIKAQNQTFGTCGQPKSGGCTMDGMLCGGTSGDGGILYTDGGLPSCGGACCSRACAPWGPTDVLICQPASGCKPVGDLCASNTDCCGGTGQNPTQTCNKSGNEPLGVCSNPSGCKPNGDICRLQTNQCNATDNCCSGNVQQYDTCHQDNLGVPRCSYAGDAGCIPVDAGTQCATSADCCNLNPCVPDGDGGYTCYPEACVPTNGVCTTDADCCPGGHCYIEAGHTSGTCKAPNPDGGTTDSGLTDSGTPCASYGQICTTSSDCCNNVPCTNGRCVIPVN